MKLLPDSLDDNYHIFQMATNAWEVKALHIADEFDLHLNPYNYLHTSLQQSVGRSANQGHLSWIRAA